MKQTRYYRCHCGWLVVKGTATKGSCIFFVFCFFVWCGCYEINFVFLGGKKTTDLVQWERYTKVPKRID